MRVIIIANGNAISETWFQSVYRPGDYLICADGGYRNFKNSKIQPNEVLGDFDSFSRDEVNCDRVKVFPAKKDKTDTEIAIDRAIELKAEEIILLGCIGTRMDHTLANIFLLKTIEKQGIKACIMDEHNRIYYVDKSIEIRGNCGDVLSLIPLSDCCEGVKTTGLYYALHGETLYRSSSRGVSNELSADRASVFVEKGEMLVILSRD